MPATRSPSRVTSPSRRPKNASAYDLLATTYGARDLVISSVAMTSRSEAAITTAMTMRILLDMSDGLILAPKARDEQTRTKVLGVTFTWAALNAAALAADRQRAKKQKRAAARLVVA